MAQYMRDDGMSWPALDFGKKRTNKTLTKYTGSGIPCLVFIDEFGMVLSDSYQDRKYLGSRKVLEDMEKTLAAGGAGPAAPAPSAIGTKAGDSSNFDDFFKKKPVQ